MKSENLLKKDVIEYILEKYGTNPEYLWKNFPEYAVFRHNSNKKWYGIIMNVSKNKLGFESNENIDIIDLKCSPLMTGSLILSEGIVKAYHMNKNNWISVLLDGTANKAEILSLIDMSYELTK